MSVGENLKPGNAADTAIDTDVPLETSADSATDAAVAILKDKVSRRPEETILASREIEESKIRFSLCLGN